MSNSSRFFAAAALITLSLPALADDMACGEYFISGDQIEPMVREEVLEKCGEPTSKTGDHWYYEEQGKVLIFTPDGSLETIQDAGEE